MTSNRYARPENFASRIRTPLLREHFVYRAFNTDGDLLYVGCTKNLAQRIDDHKRDSQWVPGVGRWRLVGPLNYETARQIERDAIQTERPLYNGNTPELAAVKAARLRILNRRLDALIGQGIHWTEAVAEAIAHADDLIPDPRGPFRADDLTVPNALRAERLDAETYGVTA